MPKLKTNSGAKKRFRVTKNKKVLAPHSGKRHGMIKKSPNQIERLRGTFVLCSGDKNKVLKHLLPNG